MPFDTHLVDEVLQDLLATPGETAAKSLKYSPWNDRLSVWTGELYQQQHRISSIVASHRADEVTGATNEANRMIDYQPDLSATLPRQAAIQALIAGDDAAEGSGGMG